MQLQTKLPSGATYTIGRLLDRGAETNSKLAKSNGAGYALRTYGLSLAPAKTSGHQTCPSSSAGCRAGCIFETGRAAVFSAINTARIAKTRAFFESRELFLSQLLNELQNCQALASKRDYKAVCRLNVFSDISWERIAPNLFADCPSVQFYDYTKNAKRMLRFCSGDFPRNYHLTFSRSENNWHECEDVLSAGGNVTIVFRSKAIPKRYSGYRVVVGDETDLRFLDKRPRIVGLYAKGRKAKHDKTGFIVD
jgi:hypothetical protein